MYLRYNVKFVQLPIYKHPLEGNSYVETFSQKRLDCLSLAACFALPLQAKKLSRMLKGNKIELPDNVQRVADLWHANNQIVLLLGGANKLVGTTTTIAANPWYSAVYPNIKNVPVLTNGETIQTEELLSHKPDAVFALEKIHVN